MDDRTKLEYYNILNSIRMMYLKSNIPFNIVNSDQIKLTYKDIKLKYIDNKNYFIKVDKSKNRSHQKIPWTKDQKKEFYKQQAKEARERPAINLNDPWTADKRDEYSKSKERSKSPNRKEFTKQNNFKKDKSRSRSPQREFTAEETNAYLERKARRERSQSPNRKEFTKGGNISQIMIFY